MVQNPGFQVAAGGNPLYEPKPGDVINTRPGKQPWWKPWERFLTWGIQRHQHKLGFTNWKDTHTVLYFRDAAVLSCTYPRTVFTSWREVQKKQWYAYRPVFFGEEQQDPAYTKKQLVIMQYPALRMLGTRYDIRQLMDIALNRLLRYNVSTYYRFFDWQFSNFVCSVAVRVCFDVMRKNWSKHGHEPPFRILFADSEGSKVHVERTTPAHFANTPEMFELVGSWENENG